MELNKIYNLDSLEFIKQLKDFDTDIIYSDPPYALGSEIIVRSDGKVDYKKATDFMNKWKMPDGYFWEEWFKESFRILKYGGYCIMFGLDRQLLLFKYYAHLAGFTEHQSLYWYFISNFPKASDLSKNIDKHFGEEREVIGNKIGMNGYSLTDNGFKNKIYGDPSNPTKECEITKPTSPLAKKYDGYKYSIAPLKQTNETIMIFQKPYKTGSCLHDTLAYENGDKECCCGALDVESGRVELNNETDKRMGQTIKYKDWNEGENKSCFGQIKASVFSSSMSGRYPSQTFCNSETSEILDRQSGISQGGGFPKGTFVKDTLCYGKYNGVTRPERIVLPAGGCSKILHKCDFEKNEHDLYFYCPKVSKSERESGLNGFEKKHSTARQVGSKFKKDDRHPDGGYLNAPQSIAQNNHPTLKPISLNYQILKLFKTPNPQNIVYPFAGAGSEIIGGEKTGFNNWKACELDSEYIEIANARIKYWKEKFSKEKEQTKLAI